MGRLTTGEICRRGVGDDIVRVNCRSPFSRGGWGGFGSEVKHRDDESRAGE